MTTLKKLKTEIRERARKTGESYTAARRQVLLARDARTKASGLVLVAPPAKPEPAPPPAPPKARRTPSGDSVVQKTGHTLDHWFAVLDAFGKDKGHTKAAAHLSRAHGVPDWHCQMITVEWERARGLRQKNQSCLGDFQVGVSKSVDAPIDAVVEAFASKARRTAWLAAAGAELRDAIEAAFASAKPPVVRRTTTYAPILRFRWDGSTVEVAVTEKAKGCSVVATSRKLASAEAVEPRRAAWKRGLDALKAHLES